MSCRVFGHTWFTKKDGTVSCGTCGTRAVIRVRSYETLQPRPSQIAAEVVAAIPQLNELIAELKDDP